MIRYPHFAHPGLYLANGYSETTVGDRVELEFDRQDELEQTIRQILCRKPERLRGWDLRFLRRGLNISQADFGHLVERDAQTVARWEKSNAGIPIFVDLTIRTRFALKFEPLMTVEDVISYVDGRADALPKKIILTLTQSGWTYDIQPWFKQATMHMSAETLVRLPNPYAATFNVYQVDVRSSGLQRAINLANRKALTKPLVEFEEGDFAISATSIGTYEFERDAQLAFVGESKYGKNYLQ